jgi:hypothetical protein
MKTKKYIVEVDSPYYGWRKSWNTGADGVYTKESAQRRARHQEKKSSLLKYRIKEIK